MTKPPTTAAEARARILATMTEAEMLEMIRECAKLGGWYCYHPWRSDHSERGWPDVMLIREGQLIVAELKSAKRRVTEEQVAVLRLFQTLEGKNPGIKAWMVRPNNLDFFLEKVMA